MSDTPISEASLTYRIPGLGSEFRRGVNCEAIEHTERGILVRRPLTEVSREPYLWDILLVASGWLKIDREPDDPNVVCDICRERCKSAQGLSAHKRYKHPEQQP